MAHGDVAGGFPSAQVTAVGGWVCFEDEAGAWLNGPVRRTWGKAGQTPVLRLAGKRNDKISPAPSRTPHRIPGRDRPRTRPTRIKPVVKDQ
jgi:hypothetical protein